MKTTMKVHAYSPRPLVDLRINLFKNVNTFWQEAENLLFLVCDTDKPRPLPYISVGADVWRTACCDIVTGAFGGTAPQQGFRPVAGLLRRSPADFLAWASNSPVIERLPLTKGLPDWVAIAQSRLSRCAPHPDDLADFDIADFTEARSALAKFF